MNVPFCDLRKLHEPIRADMDAAIRRVIDRSAFVLGSEVERFECSWADYCRMRECVGVACGLDALTLLLRANGIGPGDDVLVPSNSFVATWMAVSNVGARPVPVEPDASMTMSPALALEACTSRTAAILTTHLYGRVSDMAALRGVAKQRRIPLLVDACQAHGVRGDDLGDGAAFSFYPTKNLGCLGDGGAVVTDDQDVATEVRSIRNYGGSRKDEHERIGVNSRLDGIQAAVLSVKLAHLDEWNGRRASNARRYELELPLSLVSRGFRSVHHIFPILHTDRDRVREVLKARGVETMVHYPRAPSQQPCYRFTVPSQPVAEAFAGCLISLPTGPELTDEQLSHVAECVAAISTQTERSAA